MIDCLKRSFLWLVCLLVAACQSPVKHLDALVLVNGQPITKQLFVQQLQSQVARYAGQGQGVPKEIQQRLQESVLQRLIDDAMIMQKIQALHLDISQEILERRYEEYKSHFSSEQVYKTYLNHTQSSEEAVKEELLKSLRKEHLLEALQGNIVIGQEVVVRYYEDNQRRFTNKEQIHWQRIFWPVDEKASKKQKLKQQQEIEKVLAQTKQAKKDQTAFEALAKKYSQSPEAANGGDMGLMNRAQLLRQFSQEQVDEIFALPTGEVSSLYKSAQSIQLLRIVEHRNSQVQPLAEVEQSIRQTLISRAQNDKKRDAFRLLKQQTKVEYLVPVESLGDLAMAFQGNQSKTP